jgi:hypothetical protein
MSLCLAAGALAASLALDAFTLAWSHSIEKLRWEEDWRIEAHSLMLVEARIRGTGAGMEPPEGAVLRDGIWHYRPRRTPLATLHLAHSPYAADYELCAAGHCASLEQLLPGLPASAVVKLTPCPTGEESRR